MNRLLFGDNLKWLRDVKVFPDASVDLEYLDPPFNSNANYNVLFKEASGEASRAQVHAFADTWEWTPDVDKTYDEFLRECPNGSAVQLLESLNKFLKHSPMMAYLAMMSPRLVELHRILKPTGSLYLHCDPTASHYLKLVLDSIFGAENFVSEIIWKRHNARSTEGKWPSVHDVILLYSKTDTFFFESLQVAADKAKMPHTLITGQNGKKYQTYELTAPGMTKEGVSGKAWRSFDPSKMGRHWANNPSTMDEWDSGGLIHWPKDGGFPRRRAAEPFEAEARLVTVGDVWTDIDRINQTAKERLGYPTQKPQALLERIIEASCPPDGVVLDPFCGCGTTVHAAQKTGRQWIGIDVTYLAVNLIKGRLWDAFKADAQYEEKGQPEDLSGARRLAEIDRENGTNNFEHWALSLIKARPTKGTGSKGADRGVDGLLFFYDGKDERAEIIVQVKSGGVKRGDVATLLGDVNNQKAAGGVLITLDPPTKPMLKEAVDAKTYTAKLYQKEYPKIQILTVEGLLAGTERLEAPPQANPFAKAEREVKPHKQEEML